MLRRILLVSGIASPLLYIAGDLIAGAHWAGYSFRDQTISELAAIGAPSAGLFSLFLIVLYALMVAFGFGVWMSAEGARRLRVTGVLLTALGAFALAIGPFSAMEMRGIPQGLSGRLHIVGVLVGMLLVFGAMAFAASALRGRFALFTIVTVAVVLAFGAWAGSAGARVEQNLPTPWLGVEERICVWGYQLWFMVLAATLLRRESSGEKSRRRVDWLLARSAPS